MPKEWDAEYFRKGMKRQSENAERYAAESVSSYRRNQSRDHEHTHDMHLGEFAVCLRIMNSAATVSPTNLMDFIDTLETEKSETSGYFNEAIFLKGRNEALQRIREDVQKFIDE